MPNKAIKGIHAAVMVFTWIAAAGAALTVLLIVINVLGRFLFKQPLHGTIELVELMTVVLVYCVLPYTELHRRHVHVELVVSGFRRTVRVALAVIMCLVGTAFFFTMSWQAFRLAWENLFPLIRSTDTLSIPFGPFICVIGIGSLLLGLEMLVNALHPLPSDHK